MLSILYIVPPTFLVGSWSAKDCRLLYGYSQQFVADFLGISRISYISLENGTSRCYYDVAVKLGRLFRRLPSQLVSDDGYLFLSSDSVASSELSKFYNEP